MIILFDLWNNFFFKGHTHPIHAEGNSELQGWKRKAVAVNKQIAW